jgi:hypothetical protein
VLALLVTLAAAGTLLALLVAGLKGLRDGDRPLDVTVRAAPARTGHPEGGPRSVLVWITNPGPVPVLVGLSVRRARRPDWLAGLTGQGTELTARVPWRTSSRRFRPQAQGTVGVVGPGDSDGWPVAAPTAGRRGRLVAVIGQAGGRLRVITLAVPLGPVAGGTTTAAGTAGSTAEAPARPGRR